VARQIFASIWSTWQHPIYWLIKITNKEQMLWLKLEIYNLIQKRIITLWSKILNQHQDHDAILEEINKALLENIPVEAELSRDQED